MKNTFVRSLVTIFTVVMVMSNSLSAFAAPKTMADGTTFDAEFYANSNPDVVAAVGKGEDALYNHYVKYGKNEGRKAVADASSAENANASKYPAVVEKMARAYSENDYATIYSISKNFSKYEKELAAYITAQKSGSKRYNFETQYGKLIIVTFSDATYKSIVHGGLAFQDINAGNALIEKTNSDNARWKAKWGWDYLHTDMVYGVNSLIKNDRWTSYVSCANGCEYMEISTDGNEYLDLKCYPNNPAGTQATTEHMCM